MIVVDLPKLWTRSKTLAIAAIGTLAGLAELFDPVQAQLDQLIGTHSAGKLLTVLSIAVAINRRFTAGGVATARTVAAAVQQAQTLAAVAPFESDPPTTEGKL